MLMALKPLPSLIFLCLLSFGSPGIFLKSTFFGFKAWHETKKKEKVVLQLEMRTMAANGVVTPSWGVDQGYESNQSYA